MSTTVRQHDVGPDASAMVYRCWPSEIMEGQPAACIRREIWLTSQITTSWSQMLCRSWSLRVSWTLPGRFRAGAMWEGFLTETTELIQRKTSLRGFCSLDQRRVCQSWYARQYTYGVTLKAANVVEMPRFRRLSTQRLRHYCSQLCIW